MTKMCVTPGIEPGTFGIIARHSSAELHNTIAIYQTMACNIMHQGDQQGGGGVAGLCTQNLYPFHIAFISTRRAMGTEELHSGPQTIISSTDIWLMMNRHGTLKHLNSYCAWKLTLPPTLHSSRLEDQVATTGHQRLPPVHRRTLTAAEGNSPSRRLLAFTPAAPPGRRSCLAR